VSGAIHGRVRAASANPYQVLELTGQQPFPGTGSAYTRFQVALAIVDADRTARGLEPAGPAERTGMWTLYRLGAYDALRAAAAIEGAEVRAAIDQAPASEVA
jgi:hypothetical protein